jgi:hypothetical protein
MKGLATGNVVYVSESRIARRQGPVRIAHLPGERRPVVFEIGVPAIEELVREIAGRLKRLA